MVQSHRRTVVFGLLMVLLLVNGCGRKRFITSIDMIPSGATFGGQAFGETVQFQAIGHFNNDTTEDVTTRLTWVSVAPGIASVTSTGLATVTTDCSTLGDNVAVITATNGPNLKADSGQSVVGQATITVTKCAGP